MRGYEVQTNVLCNSQEAEIGDANAVPVHQNVTLDDKLRDETPSIEN